MNHRSEKLLPGRIHAITALSNPRVKHLKSLALKKNRDRERLFLVEGAKLVRTAWEHDWEIVTLAYAADRAVEILPKDFVARLRVRGTDILEVSKKVLGSISRRENPQMVIAAVRQKWGSRPAENSKPGTILLCLDRVRDPGNLGTIIRTADAVGVSGIVLIGDSTDPYSLEASRASMGSIFNVPLLRLSQDEFLDWQAGWQGITVGTHLKGAQDYRDVEYDQDAVLLLMGNEQQGLSDPLSKCCDVLVKIPMRGSADSINLAVATGVMLFEIDSAIARTGSAR